jgi:hypothetical protein
MSNFSENDVQRAAEIRDLLMKQISDKKEELDRLRDMLNLIDAILKLSSFKPASTISKRQYDDDQFQRDSSIRMETNQKDQRREELSTGRVITDSGVPMVDNSSEIKELRRANDSLLLAGAEIGLKNIKITPSEDLLININTPPL